jgi:hypothetical protein
MILWWMLGELLQRHSPWLLPNLLATTFYGERAYRNGFRTSTWSGLAAPFVFYCAAGVVFALAVKERWSGMRLVLASLAACILFDWVFFGLILSRVNPLVGLYSPDRLILISHTVFAFGLVSYPGFARRLLPPAEPPPLPPPMAPPPVPEADEAPGATIQQPQIPQSHEQIGGGIPQNSGEPPAWPVPFDEAGVVPRPATDENAGG